MLGFPGRRRGLELWWPEPRHDLVVEIFARQCAYSMRWACSHYHQHLSFFLNCQNALMAQAWGQFLRFTPQQILRVPWQSARRPMALNFVTPKMDQFRKDRPPGKRSEWEHIRERLAASRSRLVGTSPRGWWTLRSSFDDMPLHRPAVWLADLDADEPPDEFFQWFSFCEGQLIVTSSDPSRFPASMAPREVKPSQWLWTNAEWPPTQPRMF